MSGVFGIADPNRKVDLTALAGRMATAISHYDFHVAERFEDKDRAVVLGRTGIGIFNCQSQPVWNAPRTIALAMAGEFYNRQALGATDAAQSDEQLALALYEELGEDCVGRLVGTFVIAIWDVTRQRVLLATDRFGTYPLFYACHDGRLLFAPEMKGILCDATFSRQLDLTALAQYMRFQHLLGERTFFEGVFLLPPASVLTYDVPTTSCRVAAYWTWGAIPDRPRVEFEEAVEETSRLLQTAVRRLSSDGCRPGVYLSGGLDSRTILGLVERRPVPSVTYGASNCRDVYYARQIARAVGSDHHWIDLPDGNWVKEYVDSHLELTEGFHSWIHAHGMSTLPQARQLMDVNLTGWDGGTVMGHSDSIEPLQYAAVDEAALTARLFTLFNQNYTWPSLTEPEEDLLYAPALAARLRGVAFDSFRSELRPFWGYRPAVRAEYFYLRHHCGRLTHNLVTFYRSHIEMRFPFFDYALIDFLYSLPLKIRGHRRLYRAVIQRRLPRLSYIPYDHDEFLPTTHRTVRGAQALMVRLKNRFNRHLWPLFTQRATLYADYENYLRHELREWAETILFDRRTTERGIFNPAFLRSLMDRHVSGLEQWTIGKIAPVITYEMMLRKFYD
jgi:asparagine synthase (glutamine-hydrolysing)